uniref:Uncharacterized protein n=1 Tax=Kalanchoe fedtschenkoi TaxID=63787 RepID=A0A7N0U0N3_KALFE
MLKSGFMGARIGNRGADRKSVRSDLDGSLQVTRSRAQFQSRMESSGRCW